MSLSTDEGALSVTLHDEVLHDELELLVEMVVAASESATRLTTDQIDRLLFAPCHLRQRAN
jgi:hypothetical protein